MEKAEVQKYIADIEKMVGSRAKADMASIIALNELLTHPEAHSLFDDELKGAVKDLWLSLKSYGIELEDPPFLFGLPQGFGEDDSGEIEKSLEEAAAGLAEEAQELDKSGEDELQEEPQEEQGEEDTKAKDKETKKKS